MRSKTIVLRCLLLFIFAGSLQAQWIRAFGGSGNDRPEAVVRTGSGNYVAVGTTFSYGAGGADIWVAKFNAWGDLLWQRTYGRSGDDRAGSICRAADGGYVVAGTTAVDATVPGGLLVLKLTSQGVLEWAFEFEGNGIDDGYSLAPTADGGFVAAGYANYYVSPGTSSANGTVVKISAQGRLEWSRNYSGWLSMAHSVRQTSDGGYIVAGENVGKLAFVPAFSAMKLDASGNVVWARRYGGGGAHWIRETPDGGFILAGDPPSSPFGGSDVWVFKLDGQGAVQWQRIYGGAGDESVSAVVPRNGGFLLAGSTNSWGAGGLDAWLMKLDAAGGIEWQSVYGGAAADTAESLEGTTDGDSILLASTDSFGGGGSDFLALRIPAGGGLDPDCPFAANAAAAAVDTEEVPGDFIESVAESDLTPVDPGLQSGYTQAAETEICRPALPVIGLSRMELIFGAVENGGAAADHQARVMAQTPAQTVTIVNEGAGELDWTAAGTASWLTVAPGNGVGASIISVGVVTTGLSPGEHRAEVEVSSSRAVNSPRRISVVLNLLGSGASQEPFGIFDTPLSGSVGLSGSVPVTGWALDDVAVLRIEIYREGSAGESSASNGRIYIGDAVFVPGARPDVELAFPDYPLNSRAGWGYMMLTNFLPNQGNGTFVLLADAVDAEGHRVTLGAKTITCDNAASIKPFGAIDTPGQGGTILGAAYLNWGWALTPPPKVIPTDGSTITVVIDGVPVGNPVYNLFRQDIATLFPGYANSAGGVGYFPIDTTRYANGLHTLAWGVTDTRGETEGIGSRYFTILNPGGATGIGKSQAGGIAPVTGKNLDPAGGERLFERPPLSNGETGAVKVRGGLSGNGAGYHEILPSRENGACVIEIGEADRIEVDLGFKHVKGFLLVGGDCRSLPVGSTLDGLTGRFYWQPGPGFLGAYDFLFRRARIPSGKVIRLRVFISPEFSDRSVR